MTRPSSVLTIIVGVVLGIILTVVGMTVVAATKSPDNDMVFGDPMGANQLFTGAGMLVGCEPHQVAMIRPSGTAMPHVQCVTSAGAVSYTPYGYATVPVTAAAPALAAPAAPRSTVARTTSDRRGRSWQKTALVIGGSTAAGAGVGGLVAGKKGALIGAAIGGGASTIYEATKR